MNFDFIVELYNIQSNFRYHLGMPSWRRKSSKFRCCTLALMQLTHQKVAAIGIERKCEKNYQDSVRFLKTLQIFCQLFKQHMFWAKKKKMKLGENVWFIITYLYAKFQLIFYNRPCFQYNIYNFFLFSAFLKWKFCS